MRSKEEITASLDLLLKQSDELQVKIKETKQELAAAANAEIERLQQELKDFSTTQRSSKCHKKQKQST